MQIAVAQDDSDLVKATETDAEAFALLYDRYVQRLYHYCYHRTDNVRDAEDLTSQTFLSALEAFPRYRRDGHFAAWLFTIARNKAVDYYRRASNVPLAEAMTPPFDPDLPGDMEHAQRNGMLLRLIATLDEDEQELIRLRYVADLSFAEIARALRKSEGATKKMLYRLLGRLKVQMEAANE